MPGRSLQRYRARLSLLSWNSALKIVMFLWCSVRWVWQFREINEVSFSWRNLSTVVMRVALSHCPFGSKLLHTAVVCSRGSNHFNMLFMDWVLISIPQSKGTFPFWYFLLIVLYSIRPFFVATQCRYSMVHAFSVGIRLWLPSLLNHWCSIM